MVSSLACRVPIWLPAEALDVNKGGPVPTLFDYRIPFDDPYPFIVLPVALLGLLAPNVLETT